jgi:phage terminase large subunit
MNDLSIPYTPRPQFIPFHQRHQRWSALVCHRRMGKTVACVNDAVTRAAYTSKKNARYGYIAPFYRQAKEIAWTYLKESTQHIQVKTRESILTVDLFNGAKIQLFGADNPDAMRGLYFDGVVLDEFGDMRPSLWGEVILPTLADRRGWAVFIGTPKGRNQFWQVYKRSQTDEAWFSMLCKASQSGLLPQDELAEMQRQMTEEQYAQEFECSFEAATIGAYYAPILAKMPEEQFNSAAAQYDPNLPVEAVADLGHTDSTSIWYFQQRPDGWALIDYDEDHGKPLAFYFDLWHAKPYTFDTLWLPHDARAKTLQTGRSTVEQVLEAGFPARVQPRLAIQDGINAARKLLPSCWFAPSTAYGVECLRQYHRRYDEKIKAYIESPQHDWSSHGADAFRGFALVARERILRTTHDSPRDNSPILRLDDLWQRKSKALSLTKLRIGG